jgi:HTH-type transcriptional regulator, sugar sensing transcriptional regulator
MIEEIEDLGLSNAETKVYISLLKQGETKTGILIDKTNLQSSTVYHVLGSLLEKGLVSFILKGKIKYYKAEDPKILLELLDQKKRNIEKILPKLNEIKNINKEHQSAKVYKGIKGLTTAMNDILNTMKKNEEYYFFQAPKQNIFNPRVALFFRNYHLKRSNKGIRVKGLALNTSKQKVLEIFKGIKNSKLRFIDEFLPTGLIIYKNKIITLDFEETPTAFVIQSDTVANSYKQFFEERWKIAKK